MTIKIFKYQLDEFLSQQVIVLPDKPRILTVSFQNGVLCLWAEINTDLPSFPLKIIIIGTGQEKPANATWYLGTVHSPRGFVWHIYTDLNSINLN
jgi:hypothetical protein